MVKNKAGDAVKVKVCGITNLEDALHSVHSGCDALGFVFYKKSPRYISPEQARSIIARLPGHVIKIGVFVDTPERTIKEIAGFCKLDILQLHGRESPQFCEKFRGYKVIKAFRVKDALDLKTILRYHTFAYLFDTFVKTRIGGTGKSFNWKLMRNLDGIGRPVFLSGGLREKSVKQAIDAVHPDWVDVSTSVEISPGKKDRVKVTRFIKAAKKR
ncbi:MAG: phosphoribosylanthranilate isomerase [Deltaproteobacteria bacterium]